MFFRQLELHLRRTCLFLPILRPSNVAPVEDFQRTAGRQSSVQFMGLEGIGFRSVISKLSIVFTVQKRSGQSRTRRIDVNLASIFPGGTYNSISVAMLQLPTVSSTH